MGIPRERIVHMDGCDHTSICRFSDRNGNSYKTVLGILKLFTEKARWGRLNQSFHDFESADT